MKNNNLTPTKLLKIFMQTSCILCFLHQKPLFATKVLSWTFYLLQVYRTQDPFPLHFQGEFLLSDARDLLLSWRHPMTYLGLLAIGNTRGKLSRLSQDIKGILTIPSEMKSLRCEWTNEVGRCVDSPLFWFPKPQELCCARMTNDKTFLLCILCSEENSRRLNKTFCFPRSHPFWNQEAYLDCWSIFHTFQCLVYISQAHLHTPSWALRLGSSHNC